MSDRISYEKKVIKYTLYVKHGVVCESTPIKINKAGSLFFTINISYIKQKRAVLLFAYDMIVNLENPKKSMVCH